MKIRDFTILCEYISDKKDIGIFDAIEIIEAIKHRVTVDLESLEKSCEFFGLNSSIMKKLDILEAIK